MGRVVALKMLPPKDMRSQDAVKRFRREVKAAARLSHANIVATHDANEADGIHFLVMECVEGQDLASLVKQQGPLDVATAVNYVLQAAQGLDYAHRQGVVRRDIKPANILIDEQGVIKVLDMFVGEPSLVAGQVIRSRRNAGLRNTGNSCPRASGRIPVRRKSFVDCQYVGRRGETRWPVACGRNAVWPMVFCAE